MTAVVCRCPTIRAVYRDTAVEVAAPVAAFAQFTPADVAVHNVNAYPSTPSVSYTPPSREYESPTGYAPPVDVYPVNPAEPPPGVRLPDPTPRPAVEVSGWKAKVGPWWRGVVGFAGIAVVVFNNVLPFTEGAVKEWINTVITVASGALLFLQQHVARAEDLLGVDINADQTIGR